MVVAAGAEEKQEMRDAYRTGSIGYGDAKKRLLARVDAYFAPARERRRQLAHEAGWNRRAGQLAKFVEGVVSG